MISIFMILIVGDNTRQCFQNAILLDENELSAKTLINLRTFLPSFLVVKDKLRMMVRNKIIEFKKHLKNRFFVYVTNSINKVIKQDVCEKIFNVKVLNLLGGDIDCIFS